MKIPTIKEIVKVLERNNFKVFKEPFSTNLGGIRADDKVSNKFNDFLYAFDYDEKGKLSGVVVPATTDAGLYYRLHPINPKGTAKIVHNRQYFGAYRLMEKGHMGQKAFKQIGKIDYWRDNNKDKVLDENGIITTEGAEVATNIHYMGTIGGDVGKWSAGCQGATVSNLNKIMAVAERQKGRVYSYTLLHESLF